MHEYIYMRKPIYIYIYTYEQAYLFTCWHAYIAYT